MNRRQFLSATAATMAAGSLVPRALAASAPQTPDDMKSAPQKSDGMNYAPVAKPSPVVQPGQFAFAAVRLDHGHIQGMCNGLTEAGATLKWVYDRDPAKVAGFRAKFPQARPARAMEEVLADPEVRLVACAAVTSERAGVGEAVVASGKDYFSDKAPFTTFEQLGRARDAVARTGRKWMVYYSERLHSEAGVYATDLVAKGAIGRVLHVSCLAPHRLNKATRPAWFFERAKYGGILCDLGSHQFEQFLAYTGSSDAQVHYAVVANFANADHPELEDFGETCLQGSSGALGYVRVDWFTPDGLSSWGDGRTFLVGTDGTIELRKYVDVARDPGGDHVYLVDRKGERRFDVAGKVGYPFFGALILDCLNRTENAMTQAHAFKAAELCLKAQAVARRAA